MRIFDALALLSLTAIFTAGVSDYPAAGSPAGKPHRSSTAQAARQPAAADPFLRHPAFTPGALSQQVAGDSRVRATYARYLNVPETEAAERLRGLTPASLDSAGEFTEYRRHSNGVIYPVRVSLRRGAPVFASADRSLRLLAGSGDPIVPFAPVVNTIKAPAPPPPVETEVIVPAKPNEVIQQGTGVPANGDATPQGGPGNGGAAPPAPVTAAPASPPAAP